MFDVDDFIEGCRRAIGEADRRRAVREIVSRAVDEPAAVAAVLGRETGGINFVYRSDDLTILNVIWAPGMYLPPHDHRMWATIGIYGGQEDNAFFRRSGDGLVASGGKQLGVSDVVLLGDDTIHAVTNPTARYTGAIHVYGGDFVAQPRSQWDPDTLVESAYDIEETHRRFAAANAAVGTAP